MRTLKSILATSLFATIALLAASCSDDDTSTPTIPADVQTAMRGTYSGTQNYGSTKADSTINVTLSAKSLAVTLPASNIIKAVVGEKQKEAALSTFKADTLKSQCAIAAYDGSTATLKAMPATGRITYKIDNKNVSLVVKTSTAVAIYDVKAKTMKLNYTISSASIDGKTVSGFKSVIVTMPATVKQAAAK